MSGCYYVSSGGLDWLWQELTALGIVGVGLAVCLWISYRVSK